MRGGHPTPPRRSGGAHPPRSFDLLPLHGFVDAAPDDVVVEEAGRLHVSVHSGGAEKAKPAAAQLRGKRL